MNDEWTSLGQHLNEMKVIFDQWSQILSVILSTHVSSHSYLLSVQSVGRWEKDHAQIDR